MKIINTKNFQHKRNTIGEVVTDLDDIQQCYENILSLTKGEVPLAPNLGTDIFNAVGENPDNAMQIIKTIVYKELPLQEPRGEILSVKHIYDTNGKLKVRIHFRSKITQAERTADFYVG
ncbi:MAG: hypothetical protein ACI37T_08450 [Candidatus Gastranaerophilaceae bacterium]